MTQQKLQIAEDNRQWAVEALKVHLPYGRLALISRGETDNCYLTTVSVMLIHDAGGIPTNITRTVSAAIGFDPWYATIVPGRREAVVTLNDGMETTRKIIETEIQKVTGIERVSACWL